MLNQAFIKFHQLPKDVKLAVTSPQAMEVIDRLETTYRVSLADLIVRLMIKEVPVQDLAKHIVDSLHVPADKAAALSVELRETILRPVIGYLESQPSPVVPRPQAPAAVNTTPPPPTLRPFTRPPMLTPATRPASAQVERPAPYVPDALRQAASRPVVATIPTGKASYYVFAEDEEEIAKHRDRLQSVGGESPTAQVEERITALLARFPLSTQDEVLQKRLRGLLLSRLRDVRSSNELAELLTRPEKVGGMGLAPERAQELVAAADEEAQQLHDPRLARGLAEPQLTKPTPPPPPPEPAVIIPPPLPEPEPVVPPPPPPPPPPRPPQQSVRRPVAPTNSKLVHDIKRPAHPVSMVDELAEMSADDFRALGSDLQDSIAKVLEKIQLLAEESYEKRAEGVRAWRRSGIYKLYLSMGGESMGGGRSIEEVMADRKRRNEPYLTGAEFAAIVDLNRELNV